MRRRSAIYKTPQAGPSKISCKVFKHGIMDGSRRCGELAESGDMIPNVRTTRHLGVDELTKKGAI